MLLLARLILLTPCRCSAIFKNPDEVRQLRVSFIPFILCNRLARCTYSTSLSLESPHSDRSKKSVKVFLMNCWYNFSASRNSDGLISSFDSTSGMMSLAVFVVVDFCILGEKLKFMIYDIGRLGVPFGVRDGTRWTETFEGSLSTLRIALS